MKADIEKLLTAIGNDRHGLGDLIMHYGNPEEIGIPLSGASMQGRQ